MISEFNETLLIKKHLFSTQELKYCREQVQISCCCSFLEYLFIFLPHCQWRRFLNRRCLIQSHSVRYKSCKSCSLSVSMWDTMCESGRGRDVNALKNCNDKREKFCIFTTLSNLIKTAYKYFVFTHSLPVTDLSRTISGLCKMYIRKIIWAEATQYVLYLHALLTSDDTQDKRTLENVQRAAVTHLQPKFCLPAIFSTVPSAQLTQLAFPLCQSGRGESQTKSQWHCERPGMFF